MAVNALLQFTQGTNVGANGYALVVDTSGPVIVSNSDNSSVQSYRLELCYAPPGSAYVIMPGVTPPIVLAVGNGVPAFSFTPEAGVKGCYRFRLTTWAGPSAVGSSDVDIRCIAIPFAHGLIAPPLQKFPDPLPLPGSGLVGAKPNELNFGGQPFGWHGDDDPSHPLLYQALKQLDASNVTNNVLADGSRPFTGNQSMGGQRLTDMATPTDPTDGANKAYVDSISPSSLILNVTAPLVITDTHLAASPTASILGATTSTKGVVQLANDLGGSDTAPSVLAVHGATVPLAGSLTIGQVLQVTGGSALGYGAVADGSLGSVYVYADGTRALSGDLSMGGHKLTNLATPTASTDASTKGYVDLVAQGIETFSEVQLLASTTIASLSGEQTIDGVLTSASHVNLTQNGINNGPWITATGAWTRPPEFPIGGHAAGHYVFVQDGVTKPWKGSGWICTASPGSDVIGTNTLPWSQFSQAGIIVAGNGLTGTTTLSVQNADSSISVSAGGIAVNVISDIQHGTRGGGTQHAVSTESAAGFVPAGYDIANLAAVKQPASGWSPIGTLNTQSVITSTAGTRTLTVAPFGASFDFYLLDIHHHVSTTLSVVWGNVEGLWYFYIDGAVGSEVLHATQSLTTWISVLNGAGAPVAVIKWDATNAVVQSRSEERHGIDISGPDHNYKHSFFHTQLKSGLALSGFTINGGATNAGAQFTCGTGVVSDEDIDYAIPGATGQTLSPLTGPVFYLSGPVGAPVIRMKTADAFPFIQSGTAGYTSAPGRAAYNQNNGTNWVLTDAGNGQFFVVMIVATTDYIFPMFSVLGQNTYATLALADAAAVNEAANIQTVLGLIAPEYKILASVIYQTSAAFANSVKASVVNNLAGNPFYNLTGTPFAASGAAVGTYGGLAGLPSLTGIAPIQVAGASGVSQTLLTNLLLSLGPISAPVAASDPANKSYVDSTSYVNVRQFGIVPGAGSANPIDVKMAAMFAAVFPAGGSTDGGGPTLYFPPGDYYVGDTIAVPNSASDFEILGAGSQTTRFLWEGHAANAGHPMFRLTNSRRVSMRRFELFGSNPNAPSAGVEVYSDVTSRVGSAGVSHCRFEQLLIASVVQGILYTSATLLDPSNDDGHFEECQFVTTGDGISFERLNSLVHCIINCDFSCGRSAINNYVTPQDSVSGSLGGAFDAYGCRSSGCGTVLRIGAATNMCSVYGWKSEGDGQMLVTPSQLDTSLQGVGLHISGFHFIGAGASPIVAIDWQAGDRYWLDLDSCFITGSAGVTLNFPIALSLVQIRGGMIQFAAASGQAIIYNNVVDLFGLRSASGTPTNTNLGSGNLHEYGTHIF